MKEIYTARELADIRRKAKNREALEAVACALLCITPILWAIWKVAP